MMQQYLTIKEENKDCILFFRLGDFYEMFFEDALTVSRELELTLTGKDCGLSQRAPMCGVPFHAADTYIGRLIEKGYKVAICEQMTDPAETKGLVERKVIRIVTPGTITEGGTVSERENSYILSLCLSGDRAGTAFCDLSTGEFWVYPIKGVKQRLADELDRIAPKELLVNDREQLGAVGCRLNMAVTQAKEGWYDYPQALEVLKAHFHVPDAQALGLKGEKLCVQAAGALMAYLTDTQKNALSHILSLKLFEPQQYMTIDRVAAYNLELVQSGRGRSRRGSLLWILDKTSTAMGSRMLRSWIERPLMNPEQIAQRLDGVEQLKGSPMEADALRQQLSQVYDIERLLCKIAYESVTPRDCLALARSLDAVPAIKSLIAAMDAQALRKVDGLLDPLDALGEMLKRAISPDAPLSVKEGGIFNDDYDQRLDQLRAAATDGKTWIAQLEQKERELTGIKNLKISFNRVFGYYIEVTKSFYDQVPYRYARKQTLANCERFVTQELKDLEKTVLGADDQAVRLEYELFCQIRAKLKELLPSLQSTAQGLKTLDALLSLAQVAAENDYVRPHRADGPHRLLRPRPVRRRAHHRPHFHPHRRFRRPVRRPVHLHGGNERGGRHPEICNPPKSSHFGRGGPGHQHLRRAVHRLGGGGAHRQQDPQPRPVFHPLPRALPAGRAPGGGGGLPHHRQGAGGGRDLPAQGGARRGRPQLRRGGGQAGGVAPQPDRPGQADHGPAGGERGAERLHRPEHIGQAQEPG